MHQAKVINTNKLNNSTQQTVANKDLKLTLLFLEREVGEAFWPPVSFSLSC